MPVNFFLQKQSQLQEDKVKLPYSFSYCTARIITISLFPVIASKSLQIEYSASQVRASWRLQADFNPNFESLKRAW